MEKWTWTNDNAKYKLQHINSINFSVMIKFKEVVVFAITSHVSYIQIITKYINLELLLYAHSNCLFHRYGF